MKQQKIHNLNNRLRRLEKRRHDSKNPLNPQQIKRLGELKEFLNK
jgi:hypothetical protein